MIKFWYKFYFKVLWYSFTGDDTFLLIPSLISPRKILPPSPLNTSATALVCIFSSILNSIMEGWNYRSRWLLKAIFCYQKKTTRKQKFSWNLHEIFSDIWMKCLNPQVRINKMANEHAVDYYPSPSELTSRIHPVIFLWLLRDLYFLQNISWFFSQTCMSHHGCGKFSNSWY